MAFSNTVVYQEEWLTKYQEILAKPQNWKEICDVVYTDERVLHQPYMSTVPAVASLTRGTAYTYSTFALTDDSLTISTSYKHAQAIDRADLAQSDFISQMSMAEVGALKLNEQIEAAVMGTYGSFTSFDNASIGGAAGNITVSTTTIPKIVRGIRREIREANGQDSMSKNGVFIVWDPASFEKLEEYAQANGFNTADHALVNGEIPGFHYMGVDHFVSNSATANHLIGGVKKVITLGILKSTYGQIVVVDEPYADTGVISGVGVTMRVDYGIKVWNNISGIVFDIKVA